MGTICSVEGCGRKVQKEGLCYKCYKAKYGRGPYPTHGKKEKKRLDSRLRGDDDRPVPKSIIQKLIEIKSQKEQELAEIETAIEAIKKYL